MMIITANMAIKYSEMRTVVDVKWCLLTFLEKAVL